MLAGSLVGNNMEALLLQSSPPPPMYPSDGCLGLEHQVVFACGEDAQELGCLSRSLREEITCLEMNYNRLSPHCLGTMRELSRCLIGPHLFLPMEVAFTLLLGTASMVSVSDPVHSLPSSHSLCPVRAFPDGVTRCCFPHLSAAVAVAFSGCLRIQGIHRRKSTSMMAAILRSRRKRQPARFRSRARRWPRPVRAPAATRQRRGLSRRATTTKRACRCTRRLRRAEPLTYIGPLEAWSRSGARRLQQRWVRAAHSRVTLPRQEAWNERSMRAQHARSRNTCAGVKLCNE